MRKTYEERKGQPTKYKSGLKVYETAVTIMALAQLGTDRESGRKRRGKKRIQLEKADHVWMQEMTDWMVEHQLSNGAWGYPYAGTDESNSQYAMLALREARRLRLKVPRKVFEDAYDYWLKKQEQDGPKVRRHEEKGGDGVFHTHRTVARIWDHARGWGYRGSEARGSMTSAGVAVMAILRTELRDAKKRRRAEQAMYDGMAWLGKHFSILENPKYPRHHYYYLYGLERAGVFGGVVWMGEHRWYAEGARHLVDAQKRNGSWVTTEASGEGVVDPCFALLFLVRSTSHSYGLAPVTMSSSSAEPEEDVDDRRLSESDRATLIAVLAALATAMAEVRRAEEDGDAARLRAAVSALRPLREKLLPLLERTMSPGQRTTIHGALDDIESWLADYGAAANDTPKGDAESQPTQKPRPPEDPRKHTPPLVPQDEPAAKPLFADLDATRTLSLWCRRAAARYDDLTRPEERAALARKAAQHAGVIALPTLARWFEEDDSAMARVGIHDGLAAVGGWRVARLMRGYAQRKRRKRRMDALEVIYRCLLKPDKVEPERRSYVPFECFIDCVIASSR